MLETTHAITLRFLDLGLKAKWLRPPLLRATNSAAHALKVKIGDIRAIAVTSPSSICDSMTGPIGL